MENIDLGDDDGFVNITILGMTVPVDLWQANNRIYAYHQANKDKPDEAYNEGLIGVVESFGFPRCSQRLAQRFAQKVRERVNELAGKA